MKRWEMMEMVDSAQRYAEFHPISILKFSISILVVTRALERVLIHFVIQRKNIPFRHKLNDDQKVRRER